MDVESFFALLAEAIKGNCQAALAVHHVRPALRRYGASRCHNKRLQLTVHPAQDLPGREFAAVGAKLDLCLSGQRPIDRSRRAQFDQRATTSTRRVQVQTQLHADFLNAILRIVDLQPQIDPTDRAWKDQVE